MIEIPLTRGKVALIDDADLPLVQGYKWQVSFKRHTYYAQRTFFVAGVNRSEPMHRLIMGACKGIMVDHVDGNGLNNCRSNLRFCTPSQNAANTPKRAGLSKYKGVHRHYEGWQARIRVAQGKRYLGKFDNEIDAAKAYDRAALEVFGQFAYLNFPQASR